MQTKTPHKLPHQSLQRQTLYPGSTLAARDLGVTRYHLTAVLGGKRESKPLMRRWKQWLRENPAFARAHRKLNPSK